jgi:hypothetical protein
MEKYKESLMECNTGINWCINSNTLYLFAELHYQKGYNYELMEDYKKALYFLEQAYNIFSLQKDTKYLQYIGEKIKGMKRTPVEKVQY